MEIRSTQTGCYSTHFNLLRQQASPEVNDVGPAPIDGVIAEANYEVIDAEQPAGSDAKGVGVSARFIVNSFATLRSALTLPLGQVAVESAQLDGTGHRETDR
ncbi:MAG: hypothetical protein R3B91_18190 [Planctomycetaceae bacterium]